MPTEKKKYSLQRPDSIKVMVTKKEREELRKAADIAGMALSVFIRVSALEAARRRVAQAA